MNSCICSQTSRHLCGERIAHIFQQNKNIFGRLMNLNESVSHIPGHGVYWVGTFRQDVAIDIPKGNHNSLQYNQWVSECVSGLIINKINNVQWVDFKLENVLVSLHSLKTIDLGSLIFKEWRVTWTFSYAYSHTCMVY
jgi:hypothetical protein